MTHTKAQKFEVGNEIIDVNWYVSDNTFKRSHCWEYKGSGRV